MPLRPPAPRPSSVSGMPSFRQPGTVLTDHYFEVPLNHADPGGPQITVFAREIVAIENGVRTTGDLPWLAFLNGRPRRPGPPGAGGDKMARPALWGFPPPLGCNRRPRTPPPPHPPTPARAR